MNERSDGSVYGSLYGIDPATGLANFGLGGDSSSSPYTWHDLLTDGEVVFGVVSMFVGSIFQHNVNRCQFTRLDSTDAASRATVVYGTLSDNGLENCSLQQETSSLWAISGVGRFFLGDGVASELVVFKLKKTDMQLEEAYWFNAKETDRDLAIFKVLFDGTYFALAGYSYRFGPYHSS